MVGRLRQPRTQPVRGRVHRLLVLDLGQDLDEGRVLIRESQRLGGQFGDLWIGLILGDRADRGGDRLIGEELRLEIVGHLGESGGNAAAFRVEPAENRTSLGAKRAAGNVRRRRPVRRRQRDPPSGREGPLPARRFGEFHISGDDIQGTVIARVPCVFVRFRGKARNDLEAALRLRLEEGELKHLIPRLERNHERVVLRPRHFRSAAA